MKRDLSVELIVFMYRSILLGIIVVEKRMVIFVVCFVCFDCFTGRGSGS